MRNISVTKVTEEVARLCQEANFSLPSDVLQALRNAVKEEESPLGKEILSRLLENAEIAHSERIPVCQDCGIATVFLEVGQDIFFADGNLLAAVDEGIRTGYQEGYLRKSMVDDPLFERKNTGDNTPAIVHIDSVPGSRLKIAVVPKGGGSENSSSLAMLRVAEGAEGVKAFVVDAVKRAGAAPCPPIIVGVGIGGSFSEVALLSHRALMRPLNRRNQKKEFAELEDRLKGEVNALGIGPSGLGGRITTLGVNIETEATHIASLPVAVNIGCYATRRVDVIL
jgi:fumarate hydratase subunit alpha